MASYWSTFIRPGPHPAPRTSKGVHSGASKGGLTLFSHSSTSASDCMDTPPRSVSSTQVPLPVHSPIQVTPHHITFDDTPPPRVATPPSPPRAVIEPRPPPALPHMSPIAHRSRSRANAPLALFASGRPYRDGISYHIPTLKPHVSLKNPWALRAFAKLSPCPPRKPMALHTSVQR